jgi:hypothetical protein
MKALIQVGTLLTVAILALAVLAVASRWPLH